MNSKINKNILDKVLYLMLFLVSINFMHYGQLLLPIMCFVLFVKNDFKLKVCNWYIFSILFLFGLTFFAFSYKMGFYSVMGFCMPMAYYVGCNIQNNKESSIKKVIYIVVLGMSSYVLLNIIYNASLSNIFTERVYRLYDVWTKERILPTTIAVFYIPIIGSCFYIINNEHSKAIKIVSYIYIFIMLLYEISLGRRTPVLMTVVSLAVYLLVLYSSKGLDNMGRVVKIGIIVMAAILIAYFKVYNNNLFGVKSSFESSMIYLKFRDSDPFERVTIFLEALKYFPKYLWGGMKISGKLGINIHDYLSDTYDYAGIVPFSLLLIYTLICFRDVITKIKTTSLDFKLLIIPFLVCAFIQLLLEPIMTGNSIFLIVIIIIITMLEGLNE